MNMEMQNEPQNETSSQWLTITTSLYRVRKSSVFLQTEPPDITKPLSKPLRLARILAMAHVLNAQLGTGELDGYEEISELYRVSKARISQILELLFLAPDLQEQILFWTSPQGDDPICERDLRPLLLRCRGDWTLQRSAWDQLLASRGVETLASRGVETRP